MNENVRKRMQEIQRKRVEKWNRGRREPEEYEIGDWVWYRHPIDGSSELHGAWIGPFEVRMRTSTQSYVLWTAKRELESPASLMKRWLGPVYGAVEVPLGYEKLSRGVSPMLQERE